jgi:hypothetical protein
MSVPGGGDRRPESVGWEPEVETEVGAASLAAWTRQPEPTAEEVAAIVALLTIGGMARRRRLAPRERPSRWLRAARQEAVRRLGAATTGAAGWAAGGVEKG